MSGPTDIDAEEGSPERLSPERVKGVGSNSSHRPGERISTLKEIAEVEKTLVQGFEGGDPEQVWSAAQQLVETSKRLVIEAAKYRFKTNFGTSRCDSCTGLKVTPGVTATCFQVKQCYYSNFSETELTERQIRILRTI